MKLVNFVRSKTDRTTKHVFESHGQVIEMSFIDKQDGKDIICAPTQTSCRMGCRFCFLTGLDIPVRNLSPSELLRATRFVICDLELVTRESRNNVLLVSYMGCGEPLLNLRGLIPASEKICDAFTGDYSLVRFAVASLIPKPELMRSFTEQVADRHLQVKFHLSLHSPFDEVRYELMPGASPVAESILLTEEFVKRTGNSAEIHYALMDGVNDRPEDIASLIRLLEGKGIPVKFLRYNEKPTESFQASSRVEDFRQALEAVGIETEYYHPPGWDIGSSCGQFLMDYYLKQT